MILAWKSLLTLVIDNDDDALQLAQLHFKSGNYPYAESILNRYDLVSNNTEARYLAGHCNIKQARFPEALAILGDKTPQRLLWDNGRPGKARASEKAKARTNAFNSGGSRSDNDLKHAERVSDTRFEASMCYLRGICYAKQNAFDRAKECYKDAVRIDVRCFEAFDQLMRNKLLSPQEEWEFLGSLDFDSVMVDEDLSTSQQAGELAKMLYTTRMSKYSHVDELMTTVETLESHYNLGSNHDILLAKAETFFTRCRFREALELTTKVLEHDRYNFAVLPTHIACLYELGERNALQLISADFTEHHPDEPVSWLAVGTYYLNIGKIAEARRFFSKSSMMDPHFGPAWIGFAHTFAIEGEHDQATSAYTTAARLFQGTHLPQLYLGQQQLQLHNMDLAQEYLQTAHRLCPTDPIVLNELGVTAYQEDEVAAAIEYFNQALAAEAGLGPDSKSWMSCRTNLGHAYRRAGRMEEALAEFDEVLRGGARDVITYTTKALILLDMGHPLEATTTLHEALALNGQDPTANDLLQRAMEESASIENLEDEGFEDVDSFMASHLASAKDGARRRKGKTPNRPKVQSAKVEELTELEMKWVF